MSTAPKLAPEPQRGEASKPRPSLQSIITNVTSLVTLITGLSTAIALMVDKLPSWAKSLPTQVYWGVVLTTIVVTLYLQRKRFSGGSQLINPSVFSFSTAEHFVGRKEDVEVLLREINGNSLVWLVGESGSGKSSLVRDGLLRSLKEDSSRVPLYLDNWGADWQTGPENSLIEVLATELKMLSYESSEALTSENLMPTLSTLRIRTGRVPVLLLDQFDDYQTANRHYFHPAKGKMLTAEELKRQNAFWNGLAGLLQKGVIRCLVVTRSESYLGLESIRFTSPTVYPLERLGRGFALQLLRELVGDAAIANPDRGWNQLAARLCEDLESDGNLLPVQMRVAFRSIVNLKTLNVTEYQIQGGLLGLEASHIARHIAGAAKYAGMPETEVRRFLLALCDRTLKKTLVKSEDELRGTLHSALNNDEMVKKLLEFLEAREIVRPRSDPLATGLTHWSLYHDYLSRGVLELDRRASYWQKYLTEAAQDFQAAKTLRKWKHLLSPAAQLRLIYERLRGNITYGRERVYAGFSAAKLLVSVPIVVAVAVGGLWYYSDTQRSVLELSSVIGESNYSSINKLESEALWKLHTAPYRIRRDFLVRALTHQVEAKRFTNRESNIITAVAGLSQDTAQELIDDLIPICREQFKKRDSAESSIACSKALAHLGIDAKNAYALVSEAMAYWKNEESGPNPNNLANLTSLVEPNDAAKLLDDLLPYFNKTPRKYGAQLLFILTSRLDARQKIARLTDGWRICQLASTDAYDEPCSDFVKDVIPQLKGEDAYRLWQFLSSVPRFSSEKRSLAGVIPQSRVLPSIQEIIHKMESTKAHGNSNSEKEHTDTPYLDPALPELVSRLDPQNAKSIQKNLFEVFHKAETGNCQDYAAAVILAKADLPAEDIKRAANCMPWWDRNELLSSLQMLKPYIPKLSAKDSQELRSKVLEANRLSPMKYCQLSYIQEAFGLSSESLTKITIEWINHDLRYSPLFGGTEESLKCVDKYLDKTALNYIVKDPKAVISWRPDLRGEALVRELFRMLDTSTVNKLFLDALNDRGVLQFLEVRDNLIEIEAEFIDKQTAGEAFDLIKEHGNRNSEKPMRRTNAKLVGLLAARISPAKANEVCLELLTELDQMNDLADEQPRSRFTTYLVSPRDSILDALSVATRVLNPSDANIIFDRLKKMLVKLPESRCELLLPIADASRVQALIDILEWPTCSARDRSSAIRRISELTGQRFIASDHPGTFPSDFVEWAHNAHFKVAQAVDVQ